ILSGFLVAGSLERCRSLVSFLGLRIIRIIPALAVEVLLCALILGPFFTTLPLVDYLLNPNFHKYFLNIIGDIHYYLPGVFEENKSTQVNGQLWTVPWELACYVAISLIVIMGGYKNKFGLTSVVVIGYIMELLQYFYSSKIENVATGQITLLCFITGLWFYRNKEKIPYSKKLFIFSLFTCIILITTSNCIRFLPLPLAYITVYLGLTNPKRSAIILNGDYSYGIYLYGYAIQQAVFSISPIFNIWYFNLLVSLPLVILIAYLSWHFVELPVLQRKGFLKKIEDNVMDQHLVKNYEYIKFFFAIRNMTPMKR
ncbi:acyltransferase, partial [Actimicrobium sp. CCI2.3]|uniref:acyltransferase family protein n=1 Tax=Actimicrobium sp. CCI2.3 TaxID=3048616 RepID=UPI002B2472F9